MENKSNEMAYSISIYFLENAVNSGIIDRITFSILLRKLNEKYNPIVPKKNSLFS